MLRVRIAGDDEVRLFAFPAKRCTLGSASNNDWVCPLRGISRHHAAVAPLERSVVVTDLGSKNGLISDGERVPELTLSIGASVLLGQAELTLEEVSTTDGTLGVEFRRFVSDRSSLAFDGDTSGIDSALSSPDAWMLVRTLGRRGAEALRDPQLLARAHEALECRMVALLRLDEGDEALVTSRSGDDDAWLLRRALRACRRSSSERQTSTNKAPFFVTYGQPRLNDAIVAAYDRKPTAEQTSLVEYLGKRLEQGLCLPPDMVVGPSSAMAVLFEQLRTWRTSQLDALILGETGTGKELFARLVHSSGPSRDGPFLAINCAAIPAELLDAQLFGVERGVATGVDRRPGLFVEAGDGTLMLDEVGDLPLALQPKLLRVLQEREVLPLGASRARRIDARVIAVSNRRLPELVARGEFREDLYHRLRQLEFELPPLRDRREDIPSLVQALVVKAAELHGRRPKGVSEKALSRLQAHDWPGNVRELKTVIERAVLACPDGGVIESAHLKGAITPIQIDDAVAEGEGQPPQHRGTKPARLASRLEAVEKEEIERALERAGGNKTAAARALGVSRYGLNLKMKRLGIRVSWRP